MYIDLTGANYWKDSRYPYQHEKKKTALMTTITIIIFMNNICDHPKSKLTLKSKEGTDSGQ